MKEEGSLAAQALAIATSTERSLAAIIEMLGWSHEPLPTESHEVRKLHKLAKETAEGAKDPLDLEAIRFWGKTLLRIHPAYLGWIERLTRDKTPWAPYMALAVRVLETTPPQKLMEMSLLFGLLDVGRRNVQQAGYLYAKGLDRNTDWCVERLDGTFDTRMMEMLSYLYGSRTTPKGDRG